MKRFCDWLEKNKYIIECDFAGYNEQESIGYMIEYLLEKNKSDLYDMIEWTVIENIMELYRNLYDMIKENQ